MFIKYRLIYLAISCVISVIALLVHPVFWFVLVIYTFFIYWRLGWQFVLVSLTVMLVFIIGLQWPQVVKEPVISGKIVVKDEDDFVLKTKGTKVQVYGKLPDYQVDDEVVIKVHYFEGAKVTNDNGFDYHHYQLANGITNNAQLIKLESGEHNNTLFQKINRRFGDGIIDSYGRLFVLGVKDAKINDAYDRLTDLSVVHLFALSGLHIHLLKNLLKKWLQFFIGEPLIDYVCLVIIGLYMLVIPFNISFVRAYLVMLLHGLFKRYLNKLDCLSIVAIFFIIDNPYIIFNLSFIFSYFMYLVILLINQHRYMNLLLYLASLPIIISLQYRINILSLILGVVLVPLITWLYQGLWLYLLVGNYVLVIVDILVKMLNNIVVFAHDFSFYLNFSKPSFLFILSYYFIYFKIILKLNVKRNVKREGVLLMSLVVMFYLHPYYRIKGQVVMIDVGQGDCFLIQQPFNQGNILIDTGGLKNKDIATYTLVPYLKSQGIFSLDYVFISHDDFDHNGAFNSLSQQIEIKQTINTYQEKMTIGDVTIEMLKTPKVSDGNDNSLVILATVNHLKYLFTGDISSNVEEQLMNDYPNLHVDVLKVSHHGSSSSTSSAFLNKIKAKVALISVGKNNLYHHPSLEVISRLNDYGIKVYRSDEMGMVKIVYYGDDNYIFP